MFTWSNVSVSATRTGTSTRWRNSPSRSRGSAATRMGGRVLAGLTGVSLVRALGGGRASRERRDSARPGAGLARCQRGSPSREEYLGGEVELGFQSDAFGVRRLVPRTLRVVRPPPGVGLLGTPPQRGDVLSHAIRLRCLAPVHEDEKTLWNAAVARRSAARARRPRSRGERSDGGPRPVWFGQALAVHRAFAGVDGPAQSRRTWSRTASRLGGAEAGT